MKRVQLFEFEDFTWFPNLIRVNMLKLLNVFNKVMKVEELVAKGLEPLLKSSSENAIVDLGSGAGGVMPHVHSVLQKSNKDLTLTLTDLHPNKSQIEKFDKSVNINYASESVNATSLATAPAGIKTMINCFHHMPPEAASSILKSAQENNQSLLIYELTGKPIPLVIWFLLLPISLVITFIMALVLTFFSKPISLSQIVFTFIIPVIPLAFAWDGQASAPRTYSKADLEVLVKGLPKVANYKWNYVPATTKKGKQSGYYFIGQPISA